MEAEILREAPEIDAVLTHIESEPATIEQPERWSRRIAEIEQALRAAARLLPEIVDVHEIMWAARASTFISPAIARCPTICPCSGCTR
jgi:predicted TIM-barrel fold metal-dependent hydrolase